MTTVTTDITQSIQNDINQFTSTLQQWSATYTKSINDINTSHTNLTTTTIQQINTLNNDKENTQQSIQSNQSLNNIQLQKNILLTNELSQLNHACATLPNKHNVLQQSVQQYNSMIQQLTSQLNTLEYNKNHTINDIVTGISLFKNILGIEFGVLQKPRGVLQLNYKYINPALPNQVYTIDIYVNTNEQYVLHSCNPVLDNATQLIEQLNKHNRFDIFVMKARQQFQQYAVQQQ